jgi:hypothetical protein
MPKEIKNFKVVGYLVLPITNGFRGALAWVVMAVENRRRQDDDESFD